MSKMTASQVSLVLTLAAVNVAVFSVVAAEVTSKTDLNKSSFTQEEKDTIVQVHNSYRSLADPKATNIRELVWDNSLGDYAQQWADNCAFEHRSSNSYGENLYYITGSQYNEANAIKVWWEEGNDYTYSTQACAAVCGHYIQVMWATATQVGCGIKRCQTLPGSIRPENPAYLIVCNYDKIVLTGQKPYISGEVCSACPSEYPRCRHNLCVSESMYSNDQGFDGNTTTTGITAEYKDGAEAKRVSLFLLLITAFIVLMSLC